MPDLIPSRSEYLGFWLGLINDQIEHAADLRRLGVSPDTVPAYRERSALIDRVAAQAHEFAEA